MRNQLRDMHSHLRRELKLREGETTSNAKLYDILSKRQRNLTHLIRSCSLCLKMALGHFPLNSSLPFITYPAIISTRNCIILAIYFNDYINNLNQKLLLNVHRRKFQRVMSGYHK